MARMLLSLKMCAGDELKNPAYGAIKDLLCKIIQSIKPNKKNYFDKISRLKKGQQFELEVTGLDIGNQIETQYVALEGFSYDPLGEILVVHAPTLDHAVHHLVQIIAAEDGVELNSLFIKNTDDHTHIVQFRHPLQLEHKKQH